MADESNVTNFQEVFNFISSIFGIPNLHQYQKDCLSAIYSGRDCFVAQPTGKGKSICYQCLPVLFDILEKRKLLGDNLDGYDLNECKKTVLVISPLIGLMKDQVNWLNNIGIPSIMLKEDSKSSKSNPLEDQRLKDGKYNLVFCSPEAVLRHYRKLLRDKSFNERLVCLAVDESHCIEKWGQRSENVDAFRICYDQLSELRSLMQHQIPMIALTATATTETKDCIIKSLCLYSPLHITSSPEKTNIKYYKVDVKKLRISHFFEPFAKDIESNEYKSKRVLVFCRKLGDVRKIYDYFLVKFPSYDSFRERPYAQFHSRTKDNIKDHIIEEFMKVDGKVRFLVATIAFGMGMNCQGLNYIIHFGPPCNLDDYFQESGRGGRDGSQVHAVLVMYPRSLCTKNITKSMKFYCKNDLKCRREVLLQQFSERPANVIKPVHLCCDICSKNCSCGATNLHFPLLPLGMTVLTPSDKIEPTEYVLPVLIINEVRNQLETLRNRHIEDVKFSHCGASCISGFPIAGISEVIRLASPKLTLEILQENTSIYNTDVLLEILSIVRNVFSSAENLTDFDTKDKVSSSEESDSASNNSSFDDGSGSESDNNNDLDEPLRKKYHGTFNDEK